jgi:uncharacterized membrane protein YjgN (DUF898 family)
MSFLRRHPPAPPPAAVKFSDDRGRFFRLVARGAALELQTIGFYRFWLTTDIRRHLWANTEVDGDAAEYTGLGKELLLGFLFALAILIPVYIAYFLVGVEAARLKAFASFPLLAFFYLFGQFAIYRARRYRLTRTVWRGVRFWMDGSGWSYAARSALWSCLVLFTLGFALPWREAALERYKMRHCHYGDLQGRFEGRGWDLFKRGWWIWLAAVGLLVLLGLRKYFTPAPLIVFAAAPFLYAIFKAVEWRWWISGLRFGAVRFESRLRQGALVDLYWKVIGWSLLATAAFAVYLMLCTSLIVGTSKWALAKLLITGHLQDSLPILILAGLGYLAFILSLSAVRRIYLQRDLWDRVAASTVVHNLARARNVSAMGDIADAVGEGLADNFDVVAGF